jgi:hypothetical protein
VFKLTDRLPAWAEGTNYFLMISKKLKPCLVDVNISQAPPKQTRSE